jgi:hypothetical protein
MATSDIDIVNRALTMLGVDPINSLSDSTKAASTANRLFNDTRAAVFRGHPWNCLIKRASLPQEAQAPILDMLMLLPYRPIFYVYLALKIT